MLGICKVLSQLSDDKISNDEIFNLTKLILNKNSETKLLLLKGTNITIVGNGSISYRNIFSLLDTTSNNNRAIYGQLSTGLRMSNLHKEAEMVNSVGYLVGIFPSRCETTCPVGKFYNHLFKLQVAEVKFGFGVSPPESGFQTHLEQTANENGEKYAKNKTILGLMKC